MGPMGCPETSVRNYHYTLRNNLEQRISHVLRGGSVKSRVVISLYGFVPLYKVQCCVVPHILNSLSLSFFVYLRLNLKHVSKSLLFERRYPIM